MSSPTRLPVYTACWDRWLHSAAAATESVHGSGPEGGCFGAGGHMVLRRWRRSSHYAPFSAGTARCSGALALGAVARTLGVAGTCPALAVARTLGLARTGIARTLGVAETCPALAFARPALTFARRSDAGTLEGLQKSPMKFCEIWRAVTTDGRRADHSSRAQTTDVVTALDIRSKALIFDIRENLCGVLFPPKPRSLRHPRDKGSSTTP